MSRVDLVDWHGRKVEVKRSTFVHVRYPSFKRRFDDLVSQYNSECDSNGGHEGSTESYRLRSQIELLQEMIKHHFDVDLEFERKI